MSSLIKRSITGFFFVLVLVSCIYISAYSFFILFLIISSLGVLEFYKLSPKLNANPQNISGTIFSVALFCIAFFHASGSIDSKIWLSVIPLVLIVFITELYRNKKAPFVNIAFTLLGLLYVSVPFALLNYIVLHTADGNTVFSPQILLGTFILMWSSDTGAYLSGVTFGKHKLFERISPKKTWEGSIGGGFFTLLIAWGLSHFFKDLPLIHWLAIATINVVIGTLGDLTESLFKRSIDIKDSGNILPGHGGILDRFDSIILAAPVVYVYLEFAVR